MIRIDATLYERDLVLESVAVIGVHRCEQLAGAPSRAKIDPAGEELLLPVTSPILCVAPR